MTTENKNPELEDNQPPPVARFLGLAVSEWVTYTIILICVIAAVFGYIVGGQRDAEVDRAMATLSALTDAAEKQVAAGGSLACNDSLLTPEQLANEYLTLSVGKAPIEEDDASLGHGPALHVSVVEKEVSGDTWDTAQRLMGRIMEEGEKKAEEEAQALKESGRTVEVAQSEDAEADEDDDDKDTDKTSATRQK